MVPCAEQTCRLLRPIADLDATAPVERGRIGGGIVPDGGVSLARDHQRLLAGGKFERFPRQGNHHFLGHQQFTDRHLPRTNMEAAHSFVRNTEVAIARAGVTATVSITT